MIIRMRAVGLTGVTLVSLDSYMSPVGHFMFHFQSRNVFFFTFSITLCVCELLTSSLSESGTH